MNNAIICLTSWKARIKYLGITLYSLIRQTNPCPICITLSKEEFPNELIDLPNDIRAIIASNNISILWDNGNIRSHKKYFYAIQSYPDKDIILADDDLIYYPNFTQTLCDVSNKYKGCVIALRCHKILYDEMGYPVRYNHWIHQYQLSGCDPDLFFTSGWGTLIPAHTLQVNNALRTDINATLYADDVLLNMLCRKHNIPIYNVANILCAQNDTEAIMNSALALKNTAPQCSRNDSYINLYREYFRRSL